MPSDAGQAAVLAGDGHLVVDGKRRSLGGLAQAFSPDGSLVAVVAGDNGDPNGPKGTMILAVDVWGGTDTRILASVPDIEISGSVAGEGPCVDWLAGGGS